jgi:hypothetical protein
MIKLTHEAIGVTESHPKANPSVESGRFGVEGPKPLQRYVDTSMPLLMQRRPHAAC